MDKRWRSLRRYFLSMMVVGSFQGCDEDQSIAQSAESVPMVAPLSAGSAPAPTTPATTTIQVEIQGAVQRPGAYEFPPDTRLYEALQRAGGATPAAEIRDLNVAAPLHDGSVLTVPEQNTPEAPYRATAAQLNPSAYTRSGWIEREASSQTNAPANLSASACVDLNRATSAELEELPGVGPKTAEKIIRYREQQPFTSVEDLRNVQGIGDTRMETLGPLVCVE